jgi:hypothetical protein
MFNHSTSPPKRGGSVTLKFSLALACLALASCAIPFVPPNSTFVVVIAAVSLLLLLPALIAKAAPPAIRIGAAGLVIGIDLFALKLALT